ncbi:hypothetical protein Y032_0244g3510 [Ancylostoma ceylanicum]|uniref:G-protein coupled receptors family 1 profile domain-containing protein n=2 Tax=Ancylostoma ceylanicum TaxID=53326 RepID=A0A016SD43_9BILA|nr:hypothetical protein Y032_0244g3510 [Ancylostoma ceylanicum]
MIAIVSFSDMIHQFGWVITVISHEIKPVIEARKFTYIFVQCILPTVFGLLILIWVYSAELPSEKSVCTVSMPLRGTVYVVFMSVMVSSSIAIIFCYAVFLTNIKRKGIGSNNKRSIYRSLIIISMTVVFGWLSTAVSSITLQLLNLNVDRFMIKMISGIFSNFACACNFFVTDYRTVFNNMLHINKLMHSLPFRDPSSAKTSNIGFVVTTVKKREK